MRAGLLVLALLAPGTGASEPFAAEPRQVVGRLTGALLELARNADCWDFAERFERIRPVVRQTHALEQIAPLVLGRHWRALDEDQRTRFTEAFLDLSSATFAARFDAFSGQEFAITESVQRPRGTRAVLAEFRRPDASPIAFEFQLRESAAGWQIINILVDGVSDLALRRSEYTALMEAEGFEPLLEHLARQARDMTTAAP